jgi:hypothetical protein
VKKTCPTCQKVFETRVPQVWCSPECHWPGVCLNCGKPLYVPGGYYHGQDKKFCSRRCHYDAAAPVGKRRRWTKGYMIVKVSPETEGTRIRPPHWMLEHRYVVQQRLGRTLRPEETVHHKNGVRADNRDENLELWNGTKHPSGVRVADYHCPGCRCVDRSASEAHALGA